MNRVLFMVALLGLAITSKSETPYHYISQVTRTTPLDLSPKPLFSPHDNRREGNGRNDFGLKILGGEVGTTSTLKPLFTNVENNVYGDQALWYPVYADMQYPGWLSLGQSPIILSYGDLPEGYAPSAPPKGDPLGYSFSYQADDHTRQESSDGRGNFFSSFSFVPPADGIGLGPYGQRPPPGKAPSAKAPPVTYSGVFSTENPQVVNIPSRRPIVHQTFTQTYKPTVRPFLTRSEVPKSSDSPTARPLIGTRDGHFRSDDFANGYVFESKKLRTTGIPQTAFSINHALSTNIHYNDRELSSTTGPTSSGFRSVTIVPEVSGHSSRASTQRSYQALSRSLPLALSSQTFSAEPPASRTEKSYATLSPRKRIHDLDFRSSTRRSTTESVAFRSGQESVRQKTTSLPGTSKEPSVIQKIPRKLPTKNETYDSEERQGRPRFIDDLTVLAYSSDNNAANNSIIQIKPGKDKVVYTALSAIGYLKNSSHSLSDSISKDGYMTGNKTYLGGIGLSPNIHY